MTQDPTQYYFNALSLYINSDLDHAYIARIFEIPLETITGWVKKSNWVLLRAIVKSEREPDNQALKNAAALESWKVYCNTVFGDTAFNSPTMNEPTL